MAVANTHAASKSCTNRNDEDSGREFETNGEEECVIDEDMRHRRLQEGPERLEYLIG